VIFAAVADWADSGEFPVAFMCRELGVSRSGFYAWRAAGASRRSREELSLTSLMRRLHAQARGNPGVRRMRAMLAASGHRLAHKRVWRLMRAADLQGRHPKAWKRTTIHGEKPVPAPDLINRDFTAAAPNLRWCGDITYVRTGSGWAYVATVIDLFSRAVVGYAVDDHMRTSLVTDALDMAIRRRRPPRNVIFHSDRGTQYTSKEFAEYCRNNRIRRSLGRTGICYDNAVSESTFATFKKELVHTRPWWDLAQLKEATIDWIENYFNAIRRHSTLNYLTPREYELGFRDISQLAA
jgi:transposase InsO family protein